MRPLRVYLAAPYAARDAIRVYADELRLIGMVCTSSWLQEDVAIGKGTIGAAVDESDDAVKQHCVKDFADIGRADALVLFTGETVREMGLPGLDFMTLHTGGRHVETGYALAKGIPVIVVGHAENVFHRGACITAIDWHRAVLELVNLNRAAAS
jgi:nucleoside 2-deoxyribosyltransferase